MPPKKQGKKGAKGGSGAIVCAVQEDFTKNTMACAKIKVKDRFSSYKEFEEVLTKYKKSKLQEYWIRDARTISNQRKRFPETVSKANEDLKYYYVRLSCVKGGRKFKTKNEHSRRKCTTLRQDCPATIFLKISPCQQSLVVVEINEVHKHSASKKVYNCLSQRRVMDAYGKRMAQLCSEVPTKAFHKRVKFIQKVIEMWEEGKESVLNENFSRIFESDAGKSQEIPAEFLKKEKKEDSDSQESAIENADTDPANETKIFESQNKSQEKLDVSISEDNGNRNLINLKDIKMPRNVLKRGRPKGFGNTVTGLKKSQKSMKIKIEYRTPSTNNAETEQCLEEVYLEEYLEEYLDDETYLLGS